MCMVLWKGISPQDNEVQVSFSYVLISLQWLYGADVGPPFSLTTAAWSHGFHFNWQVRFKLKFLVGHFLLKSSQSDSESWKNLTSPDLKIQEPQPASTVSESCKTCMLFICSYVLFSLTKSVSHTVLSNCYRWSCCYSVLNVQNATECVVIKHNKWFSRGRPLVFHLV